MIKTKTESVLQYRDLLFNLVSRNLTVRYKRSAIGFLWTMLNPIIMTAVYTIVFAAIFRFGTEDFIIYFLSAFLVWNFFAQSTLDACRCIVDSGPLIKKVYVPKEVFVTSIVTSNLVNLGFAMIPLTLLLLFIGQGITISIIYFIPVIIMVAAFVLGISLLVSAMTVFFYDVGEIYRALITPWMFLTPIIYPLDIVPDKYVSFLKLNPMYYFVECFRAPFYKGESPDMSMLGFCAILAILSMLLGRTVFKRSEDYFVYYV